LSSVLAAGQGFRIMSARNVYGEPVTRGVHDGKPVRVPMAPVAPMKPVGLADVALPVDAPMFGAFVVLPE
jgi:hypothetical protein